MRCRSLFMVLATLALLASCTPRPAKDAGDQLTVPRAHPADTIAAARHLPRGLRSLWVTANLEQLTDRMGRDALIDLFRADYEEAVYRSVRRFGHDLLSPAGLRAIGIDPAGPAGVAALDGMSGPTIVVFATVAEPDTFKTAVYRLATGALTRSRRGSRPEVVEDAIIVGDSDWAVMMLPSLAMLVLGDDDAQAVAARLARLPEGESAADHEPFRAAFGGIGRSASIRGYVDLRGLTYGFLGLDPRWGGTSHAESLARIEQSHRAALARARARGAEVTELVAIDDDHVAARDSLVDDEDIPWLRPVLGSVEGLALALDLRSDGAELALRAILDPKGKVAPLVDAQVLRPTLVANVAETPGAWLHLALRPAAVLALVELTGTKAAALSQTLGIDVEKELLPLLTGEVALALSVRDRDVAALAKPKNLEVVAALGIRDAGKVKALLGKLTQAEALDSLVGRGPISDAVVTVPGMRPLFATAQGDYLVLATDKQRRVSSKHKRLPHWLATSRATRLLTEPGAAALGILDLELVVRAMLAGAEDRPPPPEMPYREPDVLASPAYDAKLKELEQLDEQMARQQDRQRARVLAPLLDLGRAVGLVGLRIDPAPDGWTLRVRHATAGRPLVAIATGLIRELSDLRKRQVRVDDDQLELILQREELFEQLNGIHDDEIEAFDAAAEKAGDAGG